MAAQYGRSSSSAAVMMLLVWITLLGVAHSQNQPRLKILPASSIQRKPVGHSLLLTCRPEVPDTNLISDLRWNDNRNMTILPKPAGQSSPMIYTESIAGGTALALIFNSLQESMAGTYFCAASYSVTEKLNAAVVVETYVAITWKDAPTDQRPLMGTDYIVRCEVTANPPATVDWLRNGDQVSCRPISLLQPPPESSSSSHVFLPNVYVVLYPD